MSDSPGQWSVVTIRGKTADVFEPAGVGSYKSAVIKLHDDDLQTPANDVAFTQQLAEASLPCVCPHGGQSWWLDLIHREFDDRITPMAYVLECVVPWVQAEWRVTPPGIGLLGIGMGGQGVLQLAYRHARMFPVVAALSPLVDFHALHGQGGPLDAMFHSAEAARQQTATLHLHPLNWPPEQLIVCDPADVLRHDGCQRLASKLSSIGIPYESDLHTSTGGDSAEYCRRMAPRCVSFVAGGLQRIRARCQ